MKIEDLLGARAAEMAAHDGVPVARVHLHGAANQLQAELLRARDGLLTPPRDAGGAERSAAVPSPAAPPVAQASPPAGPVPPHERDDGEAEELAAEEPAP